MANREYTAEWRKNMRPDESQELAAAWNEREMAKLNYQAVSKLIKDRVIKRMRRSKGET
ncbi:MAG: hypothetical protein Unbinned7865contig1001_29 [Prokaryotic dsDNA virus sp.]|nr:MAG: hypothetical protein Unbinned7865contig1001_29 [Prokaryotic dsDNA virus sp.]